MNGYAYNPGDLTREAALSMRMLPVSFDTIFKQSYFDGSVHYKHIRNPIMDFIIVNALNSTADVYANKTPSALECVLSWCVQRINASYNLGNYTEEVLDTFYTMPDLPFPWKLNASASPPAFYNSSIAIVPDPPLDSTKAFGMSSHSAFLIMFNFYQNLVPSYLTAANEFTEPTMRYRNIAIPLNPRTRNLTYNPWLGPSNNIERHLNKLAKAMTTVLRTSDTGSEQVNGEAWVVESYVHARWEWFALPAILVFSGLLFLTLTVVNSSRQNNQIGIWKTSALAILLNGVRDDVQTKFETPHLARKQKTRNRAQELRVRLNQKCDGWRLSRGYASPGQHSSTYQRYPRSSRRFASTSYGPSKLTDERDWV